MCTRTHVHTHVQSRGTEWSSRAAGGAHVSRHITVSASAAGRALWQLHLFGKTGTWPEPTLNCLMANYFSPSTVNVMMTPPPLGPCAEDRWYIKELLINLQVWFGLGWLFLEKSSAPILPLHLPGEFLLFQVSVRLPESLFNWRQSTLTQLPWCLYVGGVLVWCVSMTGGRIKVYLSLKYKLQR